MVRLGIKCAADLLIRPALIRFQQNASLQILFALAFPFRRTAKAPGAEKLQGVKIGDGKAALVPQLPSKTSCNAVSRSQKMWAKTSS
jgi:hypothetical protein